MYGVRPLYVVFCGAGSEMFRGFRVLGLRVFGFRVLGFRDEGFKA